VVEWFVVEVDEVAFEFFGGDFGFEVVCLLFLLLELALEALVFVVVGLGFGWCFWWSVDEGVEAGGEAGDGFLFVVGVGLEGDGEDVDGGGVAGDFDGVEGLGFEGGEEVLEAVEKGGDGFWGEAGGFCVFVDACAVAEFFCVEAAEVDGDGQGSDKVFGAGGEESGEVFCREGEWVGLGWWGEVGLVAA